MCLRLDDFHILTGMEGLMKVYDFKNLDENDKPKEIDVPYRDLMDKLELTISTLLSRNALYGDVFIRLDRRLQNFMPPTAAVAPRNDKCYDIIDGDNGKNRKFKLRKNKSGKVSDISLIFAPQMLHDNDINQLVEILSHEAMHILLRHIERSDFIFSDSDNDSSSGGGNFIRRKWNLACDCVVNSYLNKDLLDSCMVMGKNLDGIFPEKFKLESKQSAEYYYANLKDDDVGVCKSCDGTGIVKNGDGNQSSPGDGSDSADSDGDGNPGGSGTSGDKESDNDSNGSGGSIDVGDGYELCPDCCGSGHSGVDSHDFWEQISQDPVLKEKIARAAQSALRNAGNKVAGSMPGDLYAAIIKANETKVDWRSALRFFIKKNIFMGRNFTRKRPDRRLGYVNPGKKREYETDLVLAIDTSGSISDVDLSQFLAEMNDIVDRVAELTVVEFDSRVTKVTEKVKKVRNTWSFSGRGGTCFQPVIELLQDRRSDACIFLTDLYPCDDVHKPKNSCQIMWCGTADASKDFNPGFGKTIYMED